MKKKGRKETTIKTVGRRLELLSRYCNILNPDEVRATLANLNWKDITKKAAVSDISLFYKFYRIEWEKPEYTINRELPFIPTEAELDQLIAAAGRSYQALLQLLKETGARIGEVLKLKWIHYDSERKTVSITPEKGSNPRILPVSEKLRAMLGLIERKKERIFPMCRHSYRVTVWGLRKRLAARLSNPRLNKISFHTFRHFKGTMEYHKTKDVRHVKFVLGHKRIESTISYIQIEKSLFINSTDEWTCRAATTKEEAMSLIEGGFQFVTDIDGTKLFKKRK